MPRGILKQPLVIFQIDLIRFAISYNIPRVKYALRGSREIFVLRSLAFGLHIKPWRLRVVCYDSEKAPRFWHRGPSIQSFFPLPLQVSRGKFSLVPGFRGVFLPPLVDKMMDPCSEGFLFEGSPIFSQKVATRPPCLALCPKLADP